MDGNFSVVSQSILDSTVLEGTGTIAANRLPVFIGSGPDHAIGAVPDPGSVAGTSRVLREDGSWANLGGTVQSVALTAPNIFTVGGSPITVTGTLSLSLANQNSNLIFAGPTTGAANVPTFRGLVSNDIPSLDMSKIASGILPIAQGGTNATTAPNALTNLGAASRGANTDITSLGAVVNITSSGALTLASAASNNINLLPGSNGINILNAATSGTIAARLVGNTSTNDKTQLNFYGANFGGDIWSIGNAISTADTSKVYEIYDVVNSAVRLSISQSTGATTLPAGDLFSINTTTSQTRNIALRASDFGTSNREVRLTYYGSGVANNIFSSIPYANLGVLTFQSTDNSLIYTSGSTPLILATNSLERMRITGAGKVGIGTNNPAEVLDVVGNIKCSGTFSGPGSSITSLNATNISSGTLADARLSTNVPLLNIANSFSGAISITATGGTGYLQIANQSAAPGTPTSAGRIYFDTSNRLSWKGTNGYVRTFDGTANTADRIYTLPDAAGAVVLDSATQTLTNKSIVATQLTGTIAAARLPVFIGSGSSHAIGAVPDPGSSAGTSRILREDATWRAIDVSDTSLAAQAIISTSIDWSLSNSFTKTLTANVTFTFANTRDGQAIAVALTQDATGSRTVTWPTVSWSGGSAPTQTTTANKTDVYTFIKIGATIYGTVVQNF